MKRIGPVLAVVFFLGLISCGPGQESLRPVPRQEPPKEVPPVVAPPQAGAFPRVDGVYRRKRLTDFVEHKNVEVFDFVVFSKAGSVYHIPGSFVPPNEYGLGAPNRAIPGGWDHFPVALNDQPDYIRKWLENPNRQPPLGWPCERNAGTATATLTQTKDLVITWTAVAAVGGLKAAESELRNGRINRSEELFYEFVPFK